MRAFVSPRQSRAENEQLHHRSLRPQERAQVETKTREQVASSSHVSMEEKAAEGNVAYFSEYAAEELESKLVKYRDEDGRTLLHTASAAGASSYAPLRRVFSDPRDPRSPYAPTSERRQARPRRVLPRHRCRPRAGERQRRGARLPETFVSRGGDRDFPKTSAITTTRLPGAHSTPFLKPRASARRSPPRRLFFIRDLL